MLLNPWLRFLLAINSLFLLIGVVVLQVLFLAVQIGAIRRAA